MRKFLFFLLLPSLGLAQSAAVLKVREHRQQNENVLLDAYRSFLSIPNVAADMDNIKRNANWIMDYMKVSGIQNVQLLHPVTPNKPPAVYGEVKTPGAKETVILYAHYDGQPVDSSKWLPGLHPFRPILADGSLATGAKIIDWPTNQQTYNADWRIYGRGTSDDKAGVFTIINAYAALKANGIVPTVNIKFFFEGEEEAGSTHLPEIFDQYKTLLAADLWVICDGPVHQSGKKQVVFGVRGDTHLELTVFGPKRPLHSGHYGNWVPNPAMELSRLLASMKNEKGEVTIKGFYDDVIPLSDAEKSALAKVPSVEEQLKKELGIRKPERNAPLNETLNLPSLNINGIQSAGVGKQSANVIPTKAIASIDLRLVAGNDWEKQQQKVIDHIKSVGFYVTDKEPTDQERAEHDKICMVKRSDGYNAQKTPLDNAMAQRVVKAVAAALPEFPIQMPTLGGSLPLFIFEQKMKAQPVTIPIANYDNNQHAENENIRIQNIWDGLEIFASIMLLGK
jgi:acetylornithine deacetylase/succinyl-diaminopimelate desuccinylase-like protein